MNFLVNLILILIVGYLLGSERQTSHNLIGVRTVSLILLGSFIFTHISTQIGGDPSRIIAQIVSGIGFIGAGIIFKDGVKKIKNLTTAVLVWVLAGLGCIIALSMYKEAVTITVLVYIILKFYKKLFGHEDR